MLQETTAAQLYGVYCRSLLSFNT